MKHYNIDCSNLIKLNRNYTESNHNGIELMLEAAAESFSRWSYDFSKWW